MLLRRLQYPNTTGLILRRTYPELYKSHIVKMFEEFPELRSGWREQSKELQFSNGSRLFFGSAEHDSDMSSFYSAEFADIMVDEAQEFSQGELEGLSGSNRCTSNRDITPAMLYTFMPGVSESGIPPKGLNYLRRVLVDGERRGEEFKQKWAFVQAFAWDNIEWARKELERDGVTEIEFYSWSQDQRREYFINRTEFGAVLSSLTNKHLREAWLDGKWEVFQGQYFTNFSYDRHTIEPDAVVFKPWYRRWISCDWGFDHPACVHLHIENEHGHVTTYAELWGREKGETQLGREISQLCGSDKFSAFWMSWDAFGKLNKETKKSITELVGEGMAEGLPKPVPADASPGSRISGWRLMYQMLDSGTWTISRDCPKLIECLPTLVRDMERNSEDVLKVDHSDNQIGDDPADCARMGLQNMISLPQKPFELRVSERVEQMVRDSAREPSVTEQMLAHQRVVHEERKSSFRSFPIKRRFHRWN